MKTLLMAVTIVCGVLPCAFAQTNTGAKFGSRNPVVCSSKKEPATGAPSGQRLQDLVRCGSGGEGLFSQQLYLLENLKVEIGNGRRYQSSDSLAHNIDPSQLVYPIRGSFDKYQCTAIDVKAKMKGFNPGDNCSIYPQPNAEGICYRTTFGEWDCSMSDIAIGVGAARHYQPAPK